ncbi:hypothetical protein JTB14_024644 [Gonioctena quinquepunctata]|nr:hypothetical protein JTB14_024644 [Gonioctena quinquepunctata]
MQLKLPATNEEHIPETAQWPSKYPIFPSDMERGEVGASMGGQSTRRGLRLLINLPIEHASERPNSGRLTKAIDENGDLSANQYGFRKNKSTVLAIRKILDRVSGASESWVVPITVDMGNAFNTANWDKIINKLNKRGTPEYLVGLIRACFYEKRLITMNDVRQEISMGISQGSVLGPLLWNGLHDDVLEIPHPFWY